MAERPRIEENQLALSTALEPRPTRRYRSAEHAAESYVRMAQRVRACSALDFERLHLSQSSSPTIGNPHLEQLTEIWEIEELLDEVREATKASHWRVWRDIRGRAVSLRAAARRETTRRREEAKRIEDPHLEEWAAGYSVRPSPADDETLREAVMEQIGISKSTARNYRAAVDGKFERALNRAGKLACNVIRGEESTELG